MQASKTRGGLAMPGRMILALASMMAVVCLVSVPGQAALIHDWALDDVPSAEGDTLIDSIGGRNATIAADGYFGGDVQSTIGREGVADTAVQFHNYNSTRTTFGEHLYSVDPNDPDDPFNIVETANYNGGILGHLGDFTIDLWFRLDQLRGGFWSESITARAPGSSTGTGGDVTGMTIKPDNNLWFQMWSAVEGDPEQPAAPPPPGGWVTDRWYYAAGVYEPPILERDANGDVVWLDKLDENGDPILDEEGNPVPHVTRPANLIEYGLVSIYLWDGTNLTSDSAAANSILVYGDAGNAYDVDNFRINGTYFGNSPKAIDDLSIFNKAFDEESFLFQELGIPEPSSLAVLALGGLLLARRKRHF